MGDTAARVDRTALSAWIVERNEVLDGGITVTYWVRHSGGGRNPVFSEFSGPRPSPG